MGRVFWPFLIWSVLYNLFPWLLGLFGAGPDVLRVFFPYVSDLSGVQDLSTAVMNIAAIPLNFSDFAVHMWYIYLLIGLYLFMPVFSAWVEKASEKAKLLFLSIWAVTLFVPFIREYLSGYIWGACSWNEFYMLYNFAGFSGYLLLGHYLRHHDWSPGRILAFGIPMFLVGYAVTFFGVRHITSLPEYTAEQYELFLYYCSPNVVLMTIPVFLLCKKVNVRSKTVQRLLANLTLCGFGVYMVHYFFTGPSVALMRALDIPVWMQIPAAAVVAFGVSWLIVWFIHVLVRDKARYIVG